MLPRPLQRARCVKGRVHPGLIAESDPELLAMSGALRDIFAGAVGRPRWALEEALEAELAICPRVKIGRGLARVLENRSTFETPADVDPPALRLALFGAAAEARRACAFDRAALVAGLAVQQGRAAEQLERDLYADLPDQQLLTRFKDITPARLLQRYNVALVQSVLLDARQLTVTLAEPTPRRVRQLIASLKFHRLLFEAGWPAPEQLVLRIEGPMSLFESTRQYGLQMALFLPSVLLCERFELRAELAWGKRRRKASLELSHTSPLVSHYQDRGVWLPPEIAAFPGRFDSLESGWRITEAQRLFNLDGRGVAVPDLCFEPPDGGPPVYLELLGYWRRSSAQKHLDLLRRHGPPRYVVALSEKLCVDEQPPELKGIPTIRFKQVLRPQSVLKTVRDTAKNT